MPVIFFASTKGGVGKSTTLLNLAHAFVHHGAKVTILDVDENAYCADWAQTYPAHVPDGLRVIAELNPKSLPGLIQRETENRRVVLIDTEGTANRVFGETAHLADLVIVPLRPNRPDLKAAMRVVSLIEDQKKATGAQTRVRLLFTFTREAIVPRSQVEFHQAIVENNIPIFRTQMRELNAFTHPVNRGYRLDNLPPALAKKAESAIANINALASEIALVLTDQELDEQDEKELQQMAQGGGEERLADAEQA